MHTIFKTIKPQHPIIANYVDYYYLDVKHQNKLTAFDCFPHYNNTISIYKSHSRAANRDMVYEVNGRPYQIFTPVREEVLKVRQVGPLHRVVIVFHVMGIQRFFRDLSFQDYLFDHAFFTKEELQNVFQTKNIQEIGHLFDHYLLNRYQEASFDPLEAALKHLFENYECFSVTKLAQHLGISRRHLNRLFQQHIGVSVKRFHEIVHIRKVMEKKLFGKENNNFTQLAYALNFADQAHMNKAFKNLTQNSPNQFFKKGTLLGREDTFWHIQK